MKRTIYSVLSCVILVSIVKLFSFSSDIEDSKFEKRFAEEYQVFALTIPSNLNFAGDKVPLEDFEIKERLDKELLVNTYFHSQTMLYYKRSHRWFPIIEPILKKYGIPNDFKYLPLTESGFSNSISPKNAVGFWQILKPTGIERGLEINNQVDERYHVEKATEAACKYLLHSYGVFNNWTLVAASYNMGITGLLRQMKRQKTKSYYNLLLNDETSRYIFRILAFKEVISNPELYGFNYRDSDVYEQIPVQIVTIDSSVEQFADFAKQFNINYKLLKTFNPWLRDNYLDNPDNKTYQIKIPQINFDPNIIEDEVMNPFEETDADSEKNEKKNIQDEMKNDLEEDASSDDEQKS